MHEDNNTNEDPPDSISSDIVHTYIIQALHFICAMVGVFGGDYDGHLSEHTGTYISCPERDSWALICRSYGTACLFDITLFELYITLQP